MKNKFLWSSLMLVLYCSCDPVDRKFTVANKTNKVVSFYFTIDSTGQLARDYYSSFYDKTASGFIRKEFAYIKGNDSGNISTLGDWDTDSSQFYNGIAYIYVIDSLDIGKDSSTLEYKQLIRRYHVSICGMKSNNWIVNIN